MKGLLRKDIYMLWSYCKSFLLLILVFAVISLGETNNGFFTMYPVILAGVMPVTLISYEERCKWTIYCHTFPIARSLVVVEKYLVSALCSLFALTVTAAAQLIVFTQSTAFAWHRYLNMLSSLACFALIGPSLLLPLVFKFGSEKGRIAYYFVIGGACVLSFLAIDREFALVPFPSAIVPVIGFVAFGISCLLSIRLYEKREL